MQILHVLPVHCVTHPQTTWGSRSHCLPYCHPAHGVRQWLVLLHIYTPTHLPFTYIHRYICIYLGDARSKVHEDLASHSPPTCRMARQCHHMSGVVACSPCRGNKDMLQQEPSNPRRRLNLLRCYAGDQINVAAPGKRLVDHHTKKHLCRYRPVQY